MQIGLDGQKSIDRSTCASTVDGVDASPLSSQCHENELIEVRISNEQTQSNFKLNGNAMVIGKRIRLTPNAQSQVGSVWLQRRIRIDRQFICEFDFEIPTTGADGFAFVIVCLFVCLFCFSFLSITQTEFYSKMKVTQLWVRREVDLVI